VPNPRKSALLASAERLVQDLVRDARKPRQVGLLPDGQPNMVMPDLADQVRVADVALKFLSVKHRIAPEEEESEYERDLAELHGGSGKGNGTARPQAVHSGD